MFLSGTVSQNDDDSGEESEENLIFDEFSDDEKQHKTGATNGHAAAGKARTFQCRSRVDVTRVTMIFPNILRQVK